MARVTTSKLSPIDRTPFDGPLTYSVGSQFGYLSEMEHASIADKESLNRDLELSVGSPEGDDEVDRIINEEYKPAEPIKAKKVEAQGLYNGELNPVTLYEYAPGTDPELVKTAAAIRGIVFGRDGQIGSWRVPESDPNGSTRHLIRTSDPINLAEVDRKVLQPDERPDFGSALARDNTLLARNLSSLPEKEFTAKLDEVLDRLTDYPLNAHVHRAEGCYGGFTMGGATTSRLLPDGPNALDAPLTDSVDDMPSGHLPVRGVSLGVSFSLQSTALMSGNSGTDARFPSKVRQNVVVG